MGARVGRGWLNSTLPELNLRKAAAEIQQVRTAEIREVVVELIHTRIARSVTRVAAQLRIAHISRETHLVASPQAVIRRRKARAQYVRGALHAESRFIGQPWGQRGPHPETSGPIDPVLPFQAGAAQDGAGSGQHRQGSVQAIGTARIVLVVPDTADVMLIGKVVVEACGLEFPVVHRLVREREVIAVVVVIREGPVGEGAAAPGKLLNERISLRQRGIRCAREACRRGQRVKIDVADRRPSPCR